MNSTFSATMKMVDALMHAAKPYGLIVFSESTHRLIGARNICFMPRRYFVQPLPSGKMKAILLWENSVRP